MRWKAFLSTVVGVAMIMAALPTATAHVEDTASCSKGDQLSITVRSETDSGFVSGTFYCGGADHSCSSDDGFCSSTGGEAASDDTGSCTGDAADGLQHRHCGVEASEEEEAVLNASWQETQEDRILLPDPLRNPGPGPQAEV